MAHFLTPKQEEAYNIATSGHSLFITGQAGTGKSWIAKEIFLDLIKNGKKVFATCTTGMATLQYPPELKSTTIHHFCGISDGRYANDHLLRLLLSDEKRSIAERIQQTDVLGIDEIGMLSRKEFEQVEFICRKIRGEESLFGGILIVATGSFLQLPPIPNHDYGDEGAFCFESQLFQQLFEHKILLTDILRTDDLQLMQSISELEMGNISTEVDDFLKSLNRPIKIQGVLNDDIVRLFPTKLDVDMYNHDMLYTKYDENDIKKYTATDTKNGDISKPKIRRKIRAASTVLLSVGCPVILTYNVDVKSGLSNGQRGTVKELHKDRITVEFPTLSIVKDITPHAFTIYSPLLKKVVFTRLQVPLVLGYAITIHKSQGMTIPHLEIDCSGIFAPGQLAVSVGRGTSSNGICLKNYSKSYAFKPCEKVLSFLQKLQDSNIILNDDFSCCRVLGNNLSQLVEDSPSTSNSECLEPTIIINTDHLEFFDDDDNQFDVGDIQPVLPLPTENDLFTFSCNSSSLTDHQNELLHLYRSLLGNLRLIIFWNANIDMLQAGAKKHKCKSTKEWTAFCNALHMELINDTYLQRVYKCFGTNDLSSIMESLAFKITMKTLEVYIKSLADKYVGITDDNTTSDFAAGLPGLQGDSTTQEKIRYIAGYCIVALRKKAQRYYTATSKCLKDYQSRWKLLRLMQCSRVVIKESTIYKASLGEEERRQNNPNATHGGLTHVTDETFEFFTLLYDQTCQLQTMKNLALYGSNIFSKTIHSLFENEELWEKFFAIFPNIEDEDIFHTALMCLFEDLVRQFVYVCQNNLRKKFKTQNKIKKSQSLRSYLFPRKDQTSDKSSTKRKSKGKSKLNPKKNKDGSKKPSTLDEASSEMWPCGICSKSAETDSIGCDGQCQGWFHLRCISLDQDDIPDGEWYCDNCQ